LLTSWKNTIMTPEREYHDIPGTYVFDGTHCRLGYHLNMFCKSLDHSENREAFRSDPHQYLTNFPLSSEQTEAVINRDWLKMLRLGGNIYYTFKLAIFDGLTMQHAGAAMSGTGMTVDDFRNMMATGGRSIAGNRSRGELLGATLKAGESVRQHIDPSRRAYLVVASGRIEVEGALMGSLDGAAITNVDAVDVSALEDSELVMVEAG
ncbi:MAG: protocatechuate 4,5-dioxygenase subunit alpha, partial [Burkholderiales bacterium]